MEGIGKNLLNTFKEGFKSPEPAKQVEEPKAEVKPEEKPATPEPKEPVAQIPKPEEPKEQPKEEPKAEDPAPEPAKLEINDDAVLSYFKEKYADKAGSLENIEDLFKKPEPQADPFENVSEDVKGFVKYHKETGRGIEDWNKLNEDYSKKSPLDLARAKVAETTDLKGEDIDGYLEKKLNIDLSDPNEVDKFDLVELKSFTKDYLAQKESDKEKYKVPAAKEAEKDMVTLDNGQKIPKEEYEKLVENRNNYLESLKAAADNITKADFKVTYDDNGEKKELELAYDYSKDDVHKMTSLASDLDGTLKTLFGTDKGFNHKDLQESLFWLDKEGRGKAINAIVHKALAKRTEELMEEYYNPKFGTEARIPKANGTKRQQVDGQGKKLGTLQHDFTNV